MRHLVSYWLDACVGPPAVSLILSSEMAPPHSRKKLAYTTKLEIVQAIEKGEKKSALAKKYGVNESTIRTVYKNKKIRKVVRASPAQTPIFHSFRVKNTVLKATESVLARYVHKQNRQGAAPWHVHSCCCSAAAAAGAGCRQAGRHLALCLAGCAGCHTKVYFSRAASSALQPAAAAWAQRVTPSEMRRRKKPDL